MSDDVQTARTRDDLAGEPVRITVELPGHVLVSEGVVGSMTLTTDEDGRRTVAIVVTEATVTRKTNGLTR